MSVVQTGLRALQFLWTLLLISLIGNIIHDAYAGNPSIINYDMFVAVFGMLSLIYLIPTSIKDGMAIPIVTMALDGLNTLFWLIGGIATAAYLGAHSCSNEGYASTNVVTNGGPHMKRCREAQASTAFLWFGFATFAATTVLSIMGGGGNVNMRGGIGGIRRGAPSMSQV
ncbi:putative non-classical export protein Nce2 [Pseudovirgaria hyperparasitica]|uniref:Non-classical export protein Nce2 n=1 Tax=Pseudovirgaria hyperparasitica TaxID=470096 RepID=A0A6A6W6U3_9PEZI|nr:putative non-classical export protein Nce2 [Pseudovirgaria hyperparasitica]KAF2758343.1 putative non-classical export protein Nce2 [Pseudovirgaria hyperparasitica]